MNELSDTIRKECLMKGGVVYSNKVTTVSPTYAKETLDGKRLHVQNSKSEPRKFSVF